MTSPISKFFLLIAGSELSEKDINQVSSWLNRHGVDQLKYKVRSLRESSDYIDDTAPRRPASRMSYYETPSESTIKAAEQIDELLRIDAGLSNSQAANELSTALKKHLPAEVISGLPKVGKESFVSWIQKLSKYVPYNLLLHEAAVIRNNVMHAPRGDWPLKNR